MFTSKGASTSRLAGSVVSLSKRAYSSRPPLRQPAKPTMDQEMNRLNVRRSVSTTVRLELNHKELLDKFKDPSSHYHIPAGSKGPEHEEDHSTSRDPASISTQESADEYELSRVEALNMFENEGYDTHPKGILEWPVAWGDCDMFQYVFSVGCADG